MNHPEAKIQAAIVNWFRKKYALYKPMPLIWHNNNESKNAIEGSKFKQLGVLAGLPDLIVFWKGESIFLEVKNKTDLSPAQKHLHQILKDNQGEVYIVYNLEEAQSVLEDFIRRNDSKNA